MLDGAFTSPKIRRLAAVLGVPWPHALGLAGLLWRFTAKHAPTGEIGRHDDEEIAAALEWPGESSELVAALSRCRLLDDADPPIRFIVHDWPDHAPRYVLATLKRNGSTFSSLYEAKPSPPTDPTAVPTVVGTIVPAIDETTYTSSSTSSSSSTSTSSSPSSKNGTIARRRSVPGEVVEAIWSLWVAGRKSGKAVGLRKIRDSIRKLEADGMTIEEAARHIAESTRRDADRYRREVEKGNTELRFVPTGSTYFTQERWDDNDEQPDIQQVQQESIRDEIARTRAEMG